MKRRNLLTAATAEAEVNAEEEEVAVVADKCTLQRMSAFLEIKILAQIVVLKIVQLQTVAQIVV